MDQMYSVKPDLPARPARTLESCTCFAETKTTCPDVKEDVDVFSMVCLCQEFQCVQFVNVKPRWGQRTGTNYQGAMLPSQLASSDRQLYNHPYTRLPESI